MEEEWEGLCKVVIAFEAQHAASLKTSEANLNLWAHDQDYMADGQGAPNQYLPKKAFCVTLSECGIPLSSNNISSDIWRPNYILWIAFFLSDTTTQDWARDGGFFNLIYEAFN